MAAAPVVYEGFLDASGDRGTLFNGMKFWFSSTVPQKSRFKAQVQVSSISQKSSTNLVISRYEN